MPKTQRLRTIARDPSGKFDLLIIAVIALVILIGLVFVLLQIVGHSEEHVEKVRKTKVAYNESLRWRPEANRSESRFQADLTNNPNRVKAEYSDLNLTENCLKLVGRMSRLQELKLTRCTLSDSWLKHIEKLPLTGLGLGGTPVTDRAIPYILKFPNLTSLQLGDTEVTDKGLELLSTSRSIRYLKLNVGRCITNDGFKHIGKMTQLVSLDINDPVAVTGECLAHLTKLKNLTHLYMENARLTNEDLRHLPALINLSSLELSNCQLDDASAAELAKLSSLRNLDIGGSNITDKGLATLTKLRHLNHLSAKACQKISSGAIDEFSRQIPNCKVAYVTGAKFREKLKRFDVNQELQMLESEVRRDVPSPIELR